MLFSLIFTLMAVAEDGTLVGWNEKNGYGFIRPEEDGADVFVHIYEFEKAGLTPKCKSEDEDEDQEDRGNGMYVPRSASQNHGKLAIKDKFKCDLNMGLSYETSRGKNGKISAVNLKPR